METKMYGLPIAVLHDYNGDKATMRVRLAQKFDVVNIEGPELSKAQTVTVLNDLALFVPSALIGPRFSWSPVDDTHADVVELNPQRVLLGMTAMVGAKIVKELAGRLLDDRKKR